jgi:hypothetical protein
MPGRRKSPTCIVCKHIFNTTLHEMEDFALGLALQVASDTDVQAAFAAGDRERLIELTGPAYQQIDRSFDVPQHQFHFRRPRRFCDCTS